MHSFNCALSSCLFFLFLTKKLIPYIFSTSPSYTKLSEDQKCQWNIRLASTVHSVIVSFICVYVILLEDNFKEDLVWTYSSTVDVNLSIAVGFLSADLMLMISDFQAYAGTWRYVIHHLGAIYAYYLSLSQGVLMYFANFRLLAEMSTPTVNGRWMLAATGNKDGKIYFYNGIIMTATFFSCRIMVMPYFYYMVLKVVTSPSYVSVSWIVHISWIGVSVVLDIMNFFWFSKMVSGITKHLQYLRARSKSNLSNGIHCNGNGTITIPYDDTKYE